MHPSQPQNVPTPTWAAVDGSGFVLRVKAVPGSSRDAVAGPLGDRLKIRVAAPPEGGKANRAIIRVLARSMGVDEACISVIQGDTSPLKTIRVTSQIAHLLHDLDQPRN